MSTPSIGQHLPVTSTKQMQEPGGSGSIQTGVKSSLAFLNNKIGQEFMQASQAGKDLAKMVEKKASLVEMRQLESAKTAEREATGSTNVMAAMRKMRDSNLPKLLASTLRNHSDLAQKMFDQGRMRYLTTPEELINYVQQFAQKEYAANPAGAPVAAGGLDVTDEFVLLSALGHMEEGQLAQNAALSGRPAPSGSAFTRLVDNTLNQYGALFDTIEAELAAYEVSYMQNKKRVDDTQAKRWRHKYSWALSLTDEEWQAPLTIVKRFAENKDSYGRGGGDSRDLELPEDIFEELTDLSRGVVAQLESDISRRNKTYMLQARKTLYNIGHLITFNRALYDYLNLLRATHFYSIKQVSEPKKRMTPLERLREQQKKEEERQRRQQEGQEEQGEKGEGGEPLKEDDPFKTPAFMGALFSIVTNPNVNFSLFLIFINKYLTKFTGKEILDSSIEVSMSQKRLLFTNKLRTILAKNVPSYMYGTGERGLSQYKRVQDALDYVYNLFNETHIEIGGEKDEEPSIIRQFDDAPVHHVIKREGEV